MEGIIVEIDRERKLKRVARTVERNKENFSDKEREKRGGGGR